MIESFSRQEFFEGEEMSFSGDHAKTALLVEAGTFQAGALNFKVYEAMVADGLSMDEAIERIAFPENPEKWTMPAADAAAIAAE